MFRPWLIGALWFAFISVPLILVAALSLGRAAPGFAAFIFFAAFSLSSIPALIQLTFFYKPTEATVSSRKYAIAFALVIPFVIPIATLFEEGCTLTDEDAYTMAKRYAGGTGIEVDSLKPTSNEGALYCEFRFSNGPITIRVFGDGTIRSQPTP